jgi:glycosyltransferase involved in cell wall biosynthesis
MRICRIAPTYPTDVKPGMGLPEYYMSTHIKDPGLLITRLRRGRPFSLPGNTKLVRLPYPDSAVNNRSGVRGLLPVALKLFGYASFWLLSVPFLIWFRPHITHIHSPMPILHGLFAKYILGSRLFISFHGTDVRHVPRSRLLRALVRRADVVCYVSNAMRPILEDVVPPERLLYTPNGVSVAEFPPGGSERGPSVLMVGSLRWQKGYQDALKAFAKFRRNSPDWSLSIVGIGPERDEMEAQVHRSGLNGSVSFLGVRSRTEVAKLMRESRLFMLSSVSEGFPKVLLEAAASALPMVVTDVGSCREVAEKGAGIAVRPSDPDALASALETLATDEELWRRCARSGPEIAKEYSWESTADVVYQAYRRALAG